MFSSLFAALVGFGFAPLFFAVPAAAAFAKIAFSTVQQCGNLTVNFAGGKSPGPLHLTVLAINGSSLTIPLPHDAWNATTETGAAITFLPFPEGTQFIASLDNADDESTALISDVIVVEASPSGDTSCLPATTDFVHRYTVEDTLSQCEPFTVDFDPAQNVTAPTIRAFVPRAASHVLNETAADNAVGVDTFLMDVPRDLVTVLLFSDGTGYTETSTLLPVSGDVNSDSSCFPSSSLSNISTLETSSTSEEKVTPQ